MLKLISIMNLFLISVFVLHLVFNADGYLKKNKHHHIRYYQPEQIHIAFGANPLEIVVTWSTFNETPNSLVQFGINNFHHQASGYAKLFVDGGPEKRSQYIHRVRLTNLKPLSTYIYHCGSDYGWSEAFWFNTIDIGTDWKPKLAVYGDMGNKNARSLPRLQTETQSNEYHAILHIGDFAYDMRDDNGRVGDQFMRQIQPIAAYVPYMVCPGNHEEAYNFSHYRERFSMPGPESLFYSFNIGPMHIISINTEAYYYIEYGMYPLINQFTWLENDLKEAAKPENREKRPWIITFGHKPMYCSDDVVDDCKERATRVRTGLPITNWFGLEDMFYEYGVDVEFWAHQHSYERLWPIYDYKVKNGSKMFPYTQPKAPVHIVTGSAGCSENTVNFTAVPPEWSAYRSTHYGFTVIEVHNRSHLHLQQIAVDLDDDIIDDIWIINDKHGSFNKNNID